MTNKSTHKEAVSSSDTSAVYRTLFGQDFSGTYTPPVKPSNESVAEQQRQVLEALSTAELD